MCSNRKITAPNQLWELDIKQGLIHGENKVFYFLAYIDVFTKKVVGCHLGYNCKALHLKMTLDEALTFEGLDPKNNDLVIRSDNGPQMTSNIFRDFVDSLGTEHEFTPPSCPNKNAFVESFFSIYETQFLQVRYFKNFKDAYMQTLDFIDFYHHERLHGSLNLLPPMEFEQDFNEGKIKDYTVSA